MTCAIIVITVSLLWLGIMIYAWRSEANGSEF